MIETLTLTQLARHIGVSKRTMYNMLEDGRFPVEPIPRTNPRRWSLESVREWVAGYDHERL